MPPSETRPTIAAKRLMVVGLRGHGSGSDVLETEKRAGGAEASGRQKKSDDGRPVLAVLLAQMTCDAPGMDPGRAVAAALAEIGIEEGAVELVVLGCDDPGLRRSWTESLSSDRPGLPTIGLLCTVPTDAVTTAIGALETKVIPPAPLDAPDDLAGSGFWDPGEHSRPWFAGSASGPRRALVVVEREHAVELLLLEEAPPERARRWREGDVRPDSVLLLLSADTRDALVTSARALAGEVEAGFVDGPADTGVALAPGDAHDRGDPMDLVERARDLSTRPARRHRLGLVVDHGPAAADQLRRAADRVEKTDRSSFRTRKGVVYGDTGGQDAVSGRTAFVFPGQGSQFLGMMADLAVHLPVVRDWFDALDRTFRDIDPVPPSAMMAPPEPLTDEQRERVEANLYEQEGGVQAGFVASMALRDVLDDMSVEPDVVVGYSNGENTALIEAGVLRLDGRRAPLEHMRELKVGVNTDDARSHIPLGRAMAVSLRDRAPMERLVGEAGDRLFVSLDNCPSQVVLFGTDEAVEEARVKLRECGAICVPLPFDRAYHTPWFAEKTGHLRRLYDSIEVQPARLPIYSCVTADLFPEDPDAVRDLAASLWAEPVRFRETVRRIYDREGVRTFVEVGPGATLSGFVRDTLRGEDATALPTNAEGRPGLRPLQELAAYRFARGEPVDPSPLFPPRRPGPTVEAAAGVEHGVEPGVEPGVEGGVDPASRAARLRITEGHQELMREFLDSQERVTGMLADALESDGWRGDRPTAREVGEVPTRAPGIPASRPLLDAVLEATGQRLVATRRLDPRRDLFLRDHTLGRQVTQRRRGVHALAVLPFTFGMEMMAEASSALVGPEWVVSGLERVRGSRWIALDRGPLELRVEATRLGSGSAGPGGQPIRAAVRLLEEGGSAPLMEGTVILSRARPRAPDPLAVDVDRGTRALWEPEEFYRYCLFHGPAMQTVVELVGTGPDVIEATLRVPEISPFAETEEGASTSAEDFLLPAVLLDSAGQLAGYWLTERGRRYFGLFPYEVGRYRQFGPPPPRGTTLTARSVLRGREGAREADVDFLDGGGRLVARIEGMRLKEIYFPREFLACLYWPGPETSLSRPWSVDGEPVRRLEAGDLPFLDESFSIWLRALAHVTLAPSERETWYDLEGPDRRRSEWLLGRVAAKDAVRAWAWETLEMALSPVDVALEPDDRGKPRVHCPELEEARRVPDVSLSHSGGTVLAAAAGPERRIGVDVERRDVRPMGDWLRRGFSDPELERFQGLDSAELLPLWCAKEAAAKAAGASLGGAPRRWKVVSFDRSGGIATVEHDGRAYPVRIHDSPTESAAVCRVPAESADGPPAAGSVESSTARSEDE